MGFIFWLVQLLGRLFSLAIVLDALLSWIPYNQSVYKIRGFLQSFTAPVTAPIRKLLQPLTYRIMIDITPIVAIAVVEFLERAILTVLLKLM